MNDTNTKYTKGNYTIYRITDKRYCILDKDKNMLCKYDNDKNGIRDMINDLLYFLKEDKVIKNSATKELRKELKNYFMHLLVNDSPTVI